MRSHQVLAHTADLRLVLEGDTPQELFIAGLEGMNRILKKGFCQKQKNYPLVKKISVKSPDLTTLLIDFLSQILTYTHIDQAIFCKINISNFSQNQLTGIIFGARVDKFEEDLKAVTYHQANIQKNKTGVYQTTVIFDI